MGETIRGKAFVVGDNVDTDQIIPARHLVYDPSDPEQRKLYGRFALSGIPNGQSGLPNGDVPFVAEETVGSDYAVVVAGHNFGCGSSREHAPLAISEAGCRAVVAESYARIFYRNSVNGGYLVPLETPERLIDRIATGAELELDLAAGRLTDASTGEQYALNPLGDVAEIVAAGGIFDYARNAGLLDRPAP
jgi:3-isopropylmalate/(R)-2-methylmalate dehydratase small subunit